MKITIDRIMHECVMKGGDERGNSIRHAVNGHDVGQLCWNCGEPYATTDDLVAHIYSELTGG